jgi:hypothetical protein
VSYRLITRILFNAFIPRAGVLFNSRLTVVSLSLLVGDIEHYQHAYNEFEALGRLNNPKDIGLCVNAAKSIILMDVGRKEEALKCAEEGLKVAELAKPEFELSFHIPASICVMMKVGAYLEHEELTRTAKQMIQPWIQYFRCCTQWMSLIDALRPVAMEHPASIVECVSWPENFPSPSSESGSTSTENSHPRVPPYLAEALHAAATAQFGEGVPEMVASGTPTPSQVSVEPDIWSTEWEMATASALGLKFDEGMNLFLASGFE